MTTVESIQVEGCTLGIGSRVLRDSDKAIGTIAEVMVYWDRDGGHFVGVLVDLDGGGQSLDLLENWRPEHWQDQQPKRQTWEYCSERVACDCLYQVRGDGGRIEWHDINKLGLQGWEMVSMFPPDGSDETWAIFKRPG